jgi:hypothetical protein
MAGEVPLIRPDDELERALEDALAELDGRTLCAAFDADPSARSFLPAELADAIAQREGCARLLREHVEMERELQGLSEGAAPADGAFFVRRVVRALPPTGEDGVDRTLRVRILSAAWLSAFAFVALVVARAVGETATWHDVHALVEQTVGLVGGSVFGVAALVAGGWALFASWPGRRVGDAVGH